MIRKDREIADHSGILDIMKRCHVCRLAFNDPQSGYPYIVPMNIAQFKIFPYIYTKFSAEAMRKSLFSRPNASHFDHA